jgi:hypothetical protein
MLDGYQASHRAAKEALDETSRCSRCSDCFFSGFLSKRSVPLAGKESDVGNKSSLAGGLLYGMRCLALKERTRRYRSRPAEWTAIEIVISYCSSGDRVAKSRVEVVTLSRSL